MAPRHTQEDVEAVRDWVLERFELDLEEYGEIDYDEDQGLCFVPDSKIRLNHFANVIEGLEDYESERVSEGVTVHEISELGSTMYKHKIGVTIRPRKIPLGGGEKPIQDGEPVDETTEEALRVISQYYLNR